MSILSRPLLTAQDKLYPKLVKTRYFCPTKPLLTLHKSNEFVVCLYNGQVLIFLQTNIQSYQPLYKSNTFVICVHNDGLLIVLQTNIQSQPLVIFLKIIKLFCRVIQTFIKSFLQKENECLCVGSQSKCMLSHNG